MERLLSLAYSNVVQLSIQNRMAPEILAFPHEQMYNGSLRQGPHAPLHGRVEVVQVPDGAEETIGTSFRNRPEAVAVAELARKDEGAVIITPYAAQAHALLSQASGREVHTVDSFQGREADTVILSVVRDGSAGLGFWEDSRRLTVALTRARTRLVLVVTNPEQWPQDALLTRCVQNN